MDKETRDMENKRAGLVEKIIFAFIGAFVLWILWPLVVKRLGS